MCPCQLLWLIVDLGKVGEFVIEFIATDGSSGTKFDHKEKIIDLLHIMYPYMKLAIQTVIIHYNTSMSTHYHQMEAKKV